MIRIAGFSLIAFFFTSIAVSGQVETMQSSRVKTDTLEAILHDAEKSGIPTLPLSNKVREGIAKKRPRSEIIAAVLERKALLLQLRDQNGGVVPDAYMKELLCAEKSHIQVKTNVPTPSEKIKRTPTAPLQESPKNSRIVSNQKTAPITTDPKSSDLREKVLDRSEKENQIIKRQEKLENKMEKAAEKAEKRVEKIKNKALRKF
jgi:hypothetical protein